MVSKRYLHMNKRNKEQYILKLAIPLLKHIYGEFDVDIEQLDSPDAAIILKQPTKQKIGIEITSIDKEDVKQYFNDKKITKEVEQEQLRDIANKEYSKNPTRKSSISFPKEYIYDGVIKKTEKYINYTNSDNYDEIIILIFSSYLKLNYENFEDYHKPWTQFLLAESKFPFDKVIFVCSETKNNDIVYNKDLPKIDKPNICPSKELGITKISSSILPFSQIINLNEFFNNEPSVAKKKKNTAI